MKHPLALDHSRRTDVFDEAMKIEKNLIQLPPLRLGPSLGRTLPVDSSGGREVFRVFAELNRKLSHGNVKGMLMKGRFHERPGLKRKRLKSKSWRRRFMDGFSAVVDRVQQMRKQGW